MFFGICWFFSKFLIWVQTDYIFYQQSQNLSHAPKIYVDEGSGQTLRAVHESFVLSHMRAANAQMNLHIRRVSSQALLPELKQEEAM